MTDLNLTDPTADPNRTIRVTTWLTVREAKVIDSKRGHYNRSSYLRAAGLDKVVARAPDPIAQDQWADLGRLQGNLQQLVRHLNFATSSAGPTGSVRLTMDSIVEINSLIGALRTWLIDAVKTPTKVR